MTSPSFPASLDSLANPGPTTETDDTGFELDIVIARLQNCVMAIEQKIGAGTLSPTVGTALVGTGTGASVFSTIPTAALAANAVTQIGTMAVGVSADSTTLGIYATILGSSGTGGELRVDITTTGGDLLVWGSAIFYNTGAGNSTYLAFSLDGAAEVAERYCAPSGANEQATVATMWRFTGVTGTAASPVAHIVRARWKVNTGTGNAPGVNRSLLVMEVKR